MTIITHVKNGTKTKQNNLSQAIQTAVLNFEEKYNIQIETQTIIYTK